jgi:hypothetical protein
MNFDDPSSFLQPLGVLAVCVVAFVIYWQTYKRRIQAWQDFANGRGWDLSQDSTSYKVQGQHRGLYFSLHTEERRSGKSSQLYTVAWVSLANTLPPALHIRSEGFGDRFLKVFGKRDDEIGDAEMDEALNLKNLTDDARNTLRDARVREKLLLLRQRSPTFFIENEELQVVTRGMPDSVEALERMVTPMLELADALHEAATRARSRRSG